MTQQQNITLSLAAAAAAVAAALAVVLQRRRHRNGPSRKQLDKLETVILRNKDGVEVHITPVGASIQRFILPVAKEEARDVVLGFNKPSTYAVSCCEMCLCVYVGGSWAGGV